MWIKNTIGTIKKPSLVSSVLIGHHVLVKVSSQLLEIHFYCENNTMLLSYTASTNVFMHTWTWQNCQATENQPNLMGKIIFIVFISVTSLPVLYTFSTVPAIKWKPAASWCELFNVLRSAYSIPSYVSTRLQPRQSIQSAALMNPLQSSREQAGAASFHGPHTNYHSAKLRGWMDGWMDDKTRS